MDAVIWVVGIAASIFLAFYFGKILDERGHNI